MTLLLGLWRILRLQIWLSLLVPSTPELSHYFDPEHDKFATEDVFYQLAEAGELTAYKPPVNLTEVEQGEAMSLQKKLHNYSTVS